MAFGRYRKRRFRRRRFGRRFNSRRRRVKRFVKRVRRVAKRTVRSMSEHKYVYIPYAELGIPATTYAGRAIMFPGPSRGDGDSQRIGDKIELLRATYTIEHSYVSTATSATMPTGFYTLRFIILQAFPTQSEAAPAWAISDLFQNVDADEYHASYYAWDNIKAKGAWRILKDWKVNFTPDSLNHVYRKNVKLSGKMLRKTIQFQLGSDTEYNNMLWLVVVTNTATFLPYYVTGRMVYIDP